MVFLVREALTEEDRAAWRRVSVRWQKLPRRGYGLFLCLWLAMKLLGVFLTGYGGVILYWTGAEDPGLFAGDNRVVRHWRRRVAAFDASPPSKAA